MIVMEGRNERGERAREGAPSPGVVQAVGSGVRPVGLGAKITVVGGAGVEPASCGTWRVAPGTWAARGGLTGKRVYRKWGSQDMAHACVRLTLNA